MSRRYKYKGYTITRGDMVGQGPHNNSAEYWYADWDESNVICRDLGFHTVQEAKDAIDEHIHKMDIYKSEPYKYSTN